MTEYIDVIVCTHLRGETVDSFTNSQTVSRAKRRSFRLRKAKRKTSCHSLSEKLVSEREVNITKKALCKLIENEERLSPEQASCCEDSGQCRKQSLEMKAGKVFSSNWWREFKRTSSIKLFQVCVMASVRAD